MDCGCCCSLMAGERSRIPSWTPRTDLDSDSRRSSAQISAGGAEADREEFVAFAGNSIWSRDNKSCAMRVSVLLPWRC